MMSLIMGVSPPASCALSDHDYIFMAKPQPADLRKIKGRPAFGYFFILPSASNCLRYAHRSLTSCSFLMPAKIILVPGILALGSLMYSLKVASPHTMPEFLLASL